MPLYPGCPWTLAVLGPWLSLDPDCPWTLVQVEEDSLTGWKAGRQSGFLSLCIDRSTGMVAGLQQEDWQINHNLKLKSAKTTS